LRRAARGSLFGSCAGPAEQKRICSFRNRNGPACPTVRPAALDRPGLEKRLCRDGRGRACCRETGHIREDRTPAAAVGEGGARRARCPPCTLRVSARVRATKLQDAHWQDEPPSLGGPAQAPSRLRGKAGEWEPSSLGPEKVTRAHICMSYGPDSRLRSRFRLEAGPATGRQCLIPTGKNSRS
jgi:hypothetical protein